MTHNPRSYEQGVEDGYQFRENNYRRMLFPKYAKGCRAGRELRRRFKEDPARARQRFSRSIEEVLSTWADEYRARLDRIDDDDSY